MLIGKAISCGHIRGHILTSGVMWALRMFGIWLPLFDTGNIQDDWSEVLGTDLKTIIKLSVTFWIVPCDLCWCEKLCAWYFVQDMGKTMLWYIYHILYADQWRNWSCTFCFMKFNLISSVEEGLEFGFGGAQNHCLYPESDVSLQKTSAWYILYCAL